MIILIEKIIRFIDGIFKQDLILEKLSLERYRRYAFNWTNFYISIFPTFFIKYFIKK